MLLVCPGRGSALDPGLLSCANDKSDSWNTDSALGLEMLLGCLIKFVCFVFVVMLFCYGVLFCFVFVDRVCCCFVWCLLFVVINHII